LQNRNEQSSGLACSKPVNCQQPNSGVIYCGTVAKTLSDDMHREIIMKSKELKFRTRHRVGRGSIEGSGSQSAEGL